MTLPIALFASSFWLSTLYSPALNGLMSALNEMPTVYFPPCLGLYFAHWLLPSASAKPL